MKKKETQNYIYNLLYQIVSIAYPLILTPYTARVFGADGVGDYSYTVAINTMFTLLLTCIGRYGFREISYVKGNRAEESNTFWEIFGIKCIVFCLLIMIYLFMAFHSGRYESLFLAQSITLVYVLLDIGWYYQGKENFKLTASVSIINRVLMLILVFTFVNRAEHLVRYAFIISFICCLGSVVLWLKLLGNIDKPSRLNFKQHMKSCFLICVPFIIIELYSSVDKAMIEWITQNSFSNGYYEQTIKITKVVMVILTSMSLIKAPRHTTLAKNKCIDELRNSLYDSFSFVLMIGAPLTFGLCAVADKCVPLFLGEGYEPVIILMYLYAPFMILHGFVDILANQYFIPTKKQNKYTVAVGISCAVNIVLNVYMIKSAGAAGAVIATVISEFVCCVILVVLTRGAFDIKRIIKDNYVFVLVAVIMYVICELFSRFTNLSNIFEIIFTVIVGVTSYFVILYFIRQKYFMKVIAGGCELVKGKLKRRIKK